MVSVLEIQDFHGSSEEVRLRLDSAALIKALDYWDHLRDSRRLPYRADFNPMAIASLLSAVLLLEVRPDDTFVYRVAGADVEERYQVGSFTGKTPRETLGKDAERVLRPYRLVRDQGCVFYRNASEDWLGREPSYKSYKIVLLPFAGDDGAVSAILGVFDFLRC